MRVSVSNERLRAFAKQMNCDAVGYVDGPLGSDMRFQDLPFTSREVGTSATIIT